MRLRTGRHQDRNVYIQMGDNPSDADEYLCVFFDPARASLFTEIVNGERPPLEREPGRRALAARYASVIADTSDDDLRYIFLTNPELAARLRAALNTAALDVL